MERRCSSTTSSISPPAKSGALRDHSHAHFEDHYARLVSAYYLSIGCADLLSMFRVPLSRSIECRLRSLTDLRTAQRGRVAIPGVQHTGSFLTAP